VSATLKLGRESTGLVELRRGPFEIVVDGQSAGSIEAHETTEVPIESGSHTVQVRTGRYTSPTRTFQTVDGDVVTFRCSGARIWPVYLASLVKPDLALVLKRV